MATVSFQVDCRGVTKQRYPQAFAVKVLVNALEDVARLTTHQPFRVILDEAKNQPEYIALSDCKVARCEVTHEFAESQKDFSSINRRASQQLDSPRTTISF